MCLAARSVALTSSPLSAQPSQRTYLVFAIIFVQRPSPLLVPPDPRPRSPGPATCKCQRGRQGRPGWHEQTRTRGIVLTQSQTTPAPLDIVPFACSHSSLTRGGRARWCRRVSPSRLASVAGFISVPPISSLSMRSRSFAGVLAVCGSDGPAFTQYSSIYLGTPAPDASKRRGLRSEKWAPLIGG